MTNKVQKMIREEIDLIKEMQNRNDRWKYRNIHNKTRNQRLFSGLLTTLIGLRRGYSISYMREANPRLIVGLHKSYKDWEMAVNMDNVEQVLESELRITKEEAELFVLLIFNV